MSDSNTCPVCGAALPPDAPKGFCPRCLIRAGLEAAPPAELDADSPLPTVRDFGDYELLEEIGHGGMGVVYRARQKSLDRIVALKVLLFGPHASAESVKRFRAEAVTTAALQHPNIVAIHEVGFRESQHFIAMDFIEGRSLAKVISDFGFRISDFRRAAGYVKAIAEAVHYAHEHGILHRDLKPANVLIDANDQPRVTDFGLAKRLSATSDFGLQTQDLTVSGQMLGSPNYMPPEQATGKRGTLSRRSDVYALGAILYHTLTGRPPFGGEGLAETVQQVLNEEPPSPRLLNPVVPRDLETVCLKCLEKEPDKRYATAQMIAEELGRFLEGKPIEARPVSTAGKAWKWCRRRPALAGMAFALVLTLVLGTAGVLWQWHRAKAGELQARQNAYAADMSLSQAALEKGDLGGARAALDRQRPLPGQKDLRGWEWRYFWQRCREAGAKSAPPSPVVLPMPVWSGAFTLAPDSKHFIALDKRDGMASLWNLLPLGQVERLAFLGSSNRTVRWAPDGRTLAVGDWFGNVRIWDYPTRRLITNIANPGTQVGMLRFGGGGRTLLCGLTFRSPTLENPERRHGKLWDTQTWAEIRLPPDWPGDRIRWGAVSQDNRILAALDDQGTVAWWELASRRRLARLEHHFASKDGYLSFSPVAPLLAGSAKDGSTTVWDVTTGRVVAEIRANFKAVHGVAFAPDGQRLLSGGEDPADVVRLLDLASQRHVATLAGPPDEFWFLEMSADLNTLVAVGMDKTALLWRAPSWDEIAAAEKGEVTP